MTGLFQLTMAHAKQFFRVRQEVFLAFAFPVFFMVLLGVVLSNVPDIGNVTNEGLGLHVGLIIPEPSARGSAVRQAIEDVPTLRVEVTDEVDGLARLNSGEFAALITLPTDGDGTVRLRYNKTRTQRSRVVLNRLHEVAARVNAQLLDEPLPVTARIEGVGGEDDYSGYIEFFVPGVMAMAVFPGVVFSLTPTLVNHRERGLLRRLWLTPASMGSYLASHVLFRLGLSLLQAFLILLTAAVVFQRPFHYGVLRLLLLCGAGSVAGSAIAFLLAAIARTQAAGITLAQLIMLPMLLACGAFFPLELMPAAAMPVINALPLTPLAAGLRGVLNFDHSWRELIGPVGILLAYTLGAGVLGVRLFRWDSRV